MKTTAVIPTTLLILANTQSAYAGFIGTFTPVPEPSSMALLAIGGSAAAMAYLKKRKK